MVLTPERLHEAFESHVRKPNFAECVREILPMAVIDAGSQT
jgi:hypothetical protein